jgi:hypothetical protein
MDSSRLAGKYARYPMLRVERTTNALSREVHEISRVPFL